MARLLFILSLFIATNCLFAMPETPEKSAEAERLQARIDAQDRQIATMNGYATRLRRILSHAGLPAGDDENLTPEQKFQRVLPRVHCDHIRLVDAIDGLARVAKIEIVVDWKSLAQKGLDKNSPVNCDLGATAVQDALRAMLTPATSEDWVIFLENGAIQVTTTAQRGVKHVVMTKAYDIKALRPRGCSVSDGQDMIAKLVSDTVAPDSWRDAGGIIGSIAFKGDQMWVIQTPANHEEIESLLEDLDSDKRNEHRRRMIEVRELRLFAISAEIDKLTARCRSAGIRVPPRLDLTMDIVLPDVQFLGTPLFACFDSLREASGQIIDVHWKILQEAGFDGRTPMTLALRHQTLAGALSALVDEATPSKASDPPVRLQFAAEDNVITVSTEEDFNKQTVTRVYDIRDILPRRETRQEAVDAVIHAIVTTIAPDSWRDNGGTIGSIRDFQGQLIVTHTERGHARIKALLDGWRNTRRLLRQ